MVNNKLAFFLEIPATSFTPFSSTIYESLICNNGVFFIENKIKEVIKNEKVVVSFVFNTIAFWM